MAPKNKTNRKATAPPRLKILVSSAVVDWDELLESIYPFWIPTDTR